MRFVHSAHEGPIQIGVRYTHWLLIRRGRTRFPCRPLLSNRFLIGSGSNCHLQLGGELPMLHSLLTCEQGRWVVEMIAPAPPVRVNGIDCRRQMLDVGDTIQIADFEFVLCSNDERCRLPDSAGDDERTQLRSALQHEASRMSAAELVTHLEIELALVDRLGHRRSTGAGALMRAIQRSGASPKDNPRRAA